MAKNKRRSKTPKTPAAREALGDYRDHLSQTLTDEVAATIGRSVTTRRA